MGERSPREIRCQGGCGVTIAEPEHDLSRPEKVRLAIDSREWTVVDSLFAYCPACFRIYTGEPNDGSGALLAAARRVVALSEKITGDTIPRFRDMGTWERSLVRELRALAWAVELASIDRPGGTR